MNCVRMWIIFRTVDPAERAIPMAKRHLRLVTPDTVNRTVTPTRPPNRDLRTREYLTEAEMDRLTEAAKANRWATGTVPCSWSLTGTASGCQN